MSADLGPSWAATAAAVDRAATTFLDTVSDRLPGLLAERDHVVVFATLGRLAGGVDDPAGRAGAGQRGEGHRVSPRRTRSPS
ncbi:hypothetical protein AB0C00_29850, partial [Micromonospora carbonacea]